MTNQLIKEIRELLKGRGVISTFTFYPRINFDGVKILSCNNNGVECIMQSGLTDQKIRMPFGFMSDEALKFVRDALIE